MTSAAPGRTRPRSRARPERRCGIFRAGAGRGIALRGLTAAGGGFTSRLPGRAAPAVRPSFCLAVHLFALSGGAGRRERFRTMHAVIRTGGKQYRVAAQDVIRIEKIAGEAGDTVLFDEVLAVGSELGAPLVSGASVAGRVLAQNRADKIVVFKKKRRQNYRRKQGHRQDRTIVRIEEILTGGRQPSAKKAAPEKKPAGKAKDAEEPPAAEAPAAAPGTEAPETEAPETEAPAPAESAQAESARPADAPVFERPDGEPDDLKKLPGVGPATEKKLNALGLATYAQIAALSADEIAQVDAALKLKGKIEADDWPSLARELAGEPAGGA